MLQVRVEIPLRPSGQQGCHWVGLNETEATSTAFCKHPIPNCIRIDEQLRRHPRTDWHGLHIRRSSLLRSKHQIIWLFYVWFSLYEGLCFSRQESDHTRICEDVYFVSIQLSVFRQFLPSALLSAFSTVVAMATQQARNELQFASRCFSSLLGTSS